MRVDRSFVLIAEDREVAQVSALLEAHPKARYLIVRREKGSEIYWYAIPRAQALVMLSRLAPVSPAADALNLHEYTSTRLFREGQSSPADFIPGAVVLNERGRLIGVADPVSVAAAAPSQPAPTPAPAPPPAPDPPIRPAPGGAGGLPPSRSSFPQGWGLGLPRSDPGRRSVPRMAPPPAPSDAPGGMGDTPTMPAASGPARAPRAGAVRAPFSAWPDLQAPAEARPLEPFVLSVGFALDPQPHVTGGVIAIPEAPTEFEMLVQVSASGFSAPDGWQRVLRVDRDRPTQARVEFRLVPEDGEKAVETRSLEVFYYYQSSPCGHARRSIVIAAANATRAARRDAVSNAPAPEASPTRVGTGLKAPDLTATVSLTQGIGQREVFSWSFESPHAITLPDEPASTQLDADAAAFVDKVLGDLVTLSQGKLGDNAMRGVARDIEAKVPEAFWIALRQVAAAVAPENRVPDVLLVSEEMRLPWELAWMRRPIDDKRCSHLGAQVNLGRWPLRSPRVPSSPEAEVAWKRMAVVVGDYPASSGAALPDALLEAQKLAKDYSQGAPSVQMTDDALDHLLEGEEPRDGCEIVHFACHGRATTAAPADSALLMQDRSYFTPQVLRGSLMGEKWQPFLFLNACEVGRTGVALGETAGFAGSALSEGFRGFVGPLWRVASDTARQVAEEFYRLTLDNGMPVAQALRELRSKYCYSGAGSTPSPDTYLAYVYYGHPALRFARKP